MYNDNDHILASLYFDFRKFAFYYSIVKSAFRDHDQEITKNTGRDLLILQGSQLVKANF